MSQRQLRTSAQERCGALQAGAGNSTMAGAMWTGARARGHPQARSRLTKGHQVLRGAVRQKLRGVFLDGGEVGKGDHLIHIVAGVPPGGRESKGRSGRERGDREQPRRKGRSWGAQGRREFRGRGLAWAAGPGRKQEAWLQGPCLQQPAGQGVLGRVHEGVAT